MILELGYYSDYGQGIPESQIVLEDVPLADCDLTLMGRKKNTIKIVAGGVSCILFFSSEETFESLLEQQERGHITIVGKPNVNEWNGNVSPQILIDDYAVREKWVF